MVKLLPAWLPIYLLLVLLWGSSYAITDVALLGFTPTQIAMWRSLVGAAFLGSLMAVTGERLPRLGGRGLAKVVVLGCLTTAAHVCVATAQERMPSGAVAVLCSTTPLIAVALYWFQRVAIPPIKWVSVSLGVIGVGILLSPEAHLDHLGASLGLVAAGLFALAGNLAARFFTDSTFSGSQLTTVQLLIGAVLLTPATVIEGAGRQHQPWPDSGPLLALLALGMLAAGLGNVLFWRVLRSAGPVLAATTYQTVPVVAVLIGVVVLREPLSIGEILGAALVMGGLILLLPVVRAVGTDSDTRVETGLVGIRSETCGAVRSIETVRRAHDRRVGQSASS